MFASKAGAKMVIGIDMSNILDQAEKIVRSNGFTEDRESSGQDVHALHSCTPCDTCPQSI
jgi:23S rRNA G2069 N7-methylase RlmK/C1962 C5-methylase RlmI